MPDSISTSSATEPVWQPILDGEDRDRALALARQLAHAAIERRIDTAPTLLGRAGITVFCAYAESAGILDHADIPGMLAESIELATTMPTQLPIGLWNGGAGLRWAISHLADGEVAQAITSRLDGAIERALVRAPASMSFDLYSGLSGILLAYTEDRSPSGVRIARTIVDRLVAFDWAQMRSLPGCAHGIAGVVAALAACVTTRRDERARDLLRELAARVVATDVRGVWVSWCTGGPGIALALHAAARALGDDELEQGAIARLCASLDEIDDPSSDATLCHGTAGLAHICHRLYRATGRAELGERARAWMRRTIAIATPIAAADADPSVLVGAAGTGLALLAAATPIAPRWDRVLGAEAASDDGR